MKLWTMFCRLVKHQSLSSEVGDLSLFGMIRGNFVADLYSRKMVHVIAWVCNCPHDCQAISHNITARTVNAMCVKDAKTGD